MDNLSQLYFDAEKELWTAPLKILLDNDHWKSLECPENKSAIAQSLAKNFSELRFQAIQRRIKNPIKPTGLEAPESILGSKPLNKKDPRNWSGV